MNRFNYVALDARGRESKGTLEAADSHTALGLLKDMGFFPTKLSPVGTRHAGASPASSPKAPASLPAKPRPGLNRSFTLPWTRERLKPKALAVFTRQLSTLLEAGMPLLRGLRILEEQERSPVLKSVVRKLSASIESGGTFTEALAGCPRIFNQLYISMSRAGELSGSLDVVLDRLAMFLEKAEKIKGKIVAAMFYPITVLTVAVAIMGALMVFVIPKFREVFASMLEGQRLPLFTELVLGISQVVKEHCLAAVVVAAAVAVALRLAATTHAGRRVLDQMKLRAPVFGPVFAKAAIARFSRTLGTLVNSGVPILQALTIVKETAGNVIVGDAVESVHRSVKEGETIAVPLRMSRVFPAMVVGMVDIGEQSGALPDMLLKIADNYDDEVDNAVAAMTSLLEPIMIVILAVIVGSIVIALFLPMITMIDRFGGQDGDSGSLTN